MVSALSVLLTVGVTTASKKPMLQRGIGIDLGTTMSVVSSFSMINDNPESEIIPDSSQNRLTPSVVAIDPGDGRTMVGSDAVEEMLHNPSSVFYGVKRWLGRDFAKIDSSEYDQLPFRLQECLPLVQSAGWLDGLKARLGFGGDADEQFDSTAFATKPCISAKSGLTKTSLYPLEFISASVLRYLLSGFKEKLGGGVHDFTDGVVITVPAYFKDPQRQATLTAARAAGLNPLTVLNEPTAAALYLAMDEARKGKLNMLSGTKQVLVFDFGGGTLDISIVKTSAEADEVLGTHGDNFLGGENIDEVIAGWILKEHARKSGNSLLTDDISKTMARKAAKKAKEQLSMKERWEIKKIRFNDGTVFTKVLTRDKFNKICETPIWSKINPVIDRAIANAVDVSSEDDIDIVIMVGGSTRNQRVQQMLRQRFDSNSWTDQLGLEDKTTKVRFVGNPDEAVARGAAIHAFKLVNADALKRMAEDVKVETKQLEQIVEDARADLQRAENDHSLDSSVVRDASAKVKEAEGRLATRNDPDAASGIVERIAISIFGESAERKQRRLKEAAHAKEQARRDVEKARAEEDRARRNAELSAHKVQAKQRKMHEATDKKDTFNPPTILRPLIDINTHTLGLEVVKSNCGANIHSPDGFDMQLTIRDFSDSHQDFELEGVQYDPGVDKNIVQSRLDDDRKPVLCVGSTVTCFSKRSVKSTQLEFRDWYRDSLSSYKKLHTIRMTRSHGRMYKYCSDSTAGFYPLDDWHQGHSRTAEERRLGHKFWFTTEFKGEFVYTGGESFHFSGDDDFWVFVDGKLVIDLGGLHMRTDATLVLDDLNLQRGETYTLDIFHAERHTDKSNFCMETSIDINGLVSATRATGHSADVPDACLLNDPLIKMNSKLPITVTKIYTTSHDNQESIRVRVLQGEERMAAHRDNTQVLTFDVHGLPQSKAGSPKIEVTYYMDEGGVLHVSANELISGVSGSRSLQLKTGTMDQATHKNLARHLENLEHQRYLDEF